MTNRLEAVEIDRNEYRSKFEAEEQKNKLLWEEIMRKENEIRRYVQRKVRPENHTSTQQQRLVSVNQSLTGTVLLYLF